MSPDERELLLLRQLVALRAEHPHHEALRIAAAGLAPGGLRSRVDGALRALAAGAATGADVLAAATPVEQLRLEVVAVEAQLQLAAFSRAVRITAGGLAAMPGLVLGFAGGLRLSLAATVFSPDSALDAPTWSWAMLLAGLPMAALPGLAAFLLTGRFRPGSRPLRVATAAAGQAARAPGQIPPELNDVEAAFFVARAGKVGAVAAAAELAEALVQEGHARLVWLRTVGPVLLATSAVLGLALAAGAALQLVTSMAGGFS